MERHLRGPGPVLAISLGIIGTVLASQYLGGLEPCILCYYQRYPWYAIIALMVVALALPARGQAVLLGAAAVLFALGTAIAFYHVGVEHKVFAGPAACGSATITGQSVDALRAQIVGKPVVRCDQPAWALFGISMAGYNLVASAAMAAFSLWLARTAWKGRP